MAKKKFHWKTADVVKDLAALSPLITKVESFGPGGDYDTDNIIVRISEGDPLYVNGFPSTEEVCESPSDVVCQYIELKDGRYSDGGLHSTKDNTVDVYAAIYKYFAKFDVSIIRHYKEIF